MKSHSRLFDCTYDLLKVVLTLFVIFCHWSGYYQEEAVSPFYRIIQPIADYLAVPVFFVFSGFLFFFSMKQPSWGFFTNKWKRRVHTLLIPYLLWITIFIFFKGYCFRPFLNYLDGIGWFKAYWSCYNAGMPILFPLWYIRDLILFCLISPVIYYLIRHFKIYIVILLTLLWIFGVWPTQPEFCRSGLIYFSLGASFAILKIDFLSFLYSKRLVSAITFIAFYILSSVYTNVSLFEHCKSLFAVFSVIGLTVMIVKKRVVIPKSWAKSSFFIYCSHYFFIPYCYKLTFITNPPSLWALWIYFSTPFFLLILLHAIYLFFYSIFPRFVLILTGSR